MNKILTVAVLSLVVAAVMATSVAFQIASAFTGNDHAHENINENSVHDFVST